MNKEYFLGLNSLRAYAAFAVIYSHIIQNVFPDPLFLAFKYFLIDASSAVSLFFVLSGFLITYLLLTESTKNKKVSIGKFYIRRILKIWPLYYAIVIIGLLIFPVVFGKDYIYTVFYPDNVLIIPIKTQMLLAFCLLPNYATITAPMEHLWSIGIEEQFYVVWPWIFRHKLSIVKVSLGILIVKFIISLVIPTLSIPGAKRIVDEGRFECMAIGALGAYVYFNKLPLLKFVYSKVTQVLVLIAFIYMTGRNIPVTFLNTMGISTIFIILILNLSTNQRALIKIHNPLTEQLGKISYGLYLYHFPILYIFLKFTPQILFNNILLYPTIVSFSTIVATWLTASLSYKWFEMPFLNLKEKYSTI
ncbi:MAG: acyltransferase family protein [Chloroflexota bacterium]